MEGDRKSYSEESQNIIRKQRSTIEKLKSDNESLSEELNLETKHAKFSGSASISAQIAKMQDQVDMYTRKNDLERRKIEEVDKQITRFQKDILAQRQKMKGTSSRDHANKIAKQIRVLENRLDKALQQFNMALAHNKKLREEIDNLRRERVVFDGIYKKLEFELQQKKMRMTDIIDVANTAYEARDAAQADMTALKLQVDKENQDFEITWKDLNKEIEKDRKNKDIQKFKEREREKGGDQRGDLSIEEEAKLRRKVTKNTWSIAKEKATISVVQEKNENTEQVLNKIVSQCPGYSNIDDLVAQFINAEAQNYSHFNYVNELNTEIEKAEEALEAVKSEHDMYEKKNLAAAHQNQQITTDLRARVDKMTDKAKMYEQKEESSKSTLMSLKQGIDKVFQLLQCNQNDVVELLGDVGKVSDTNMLQYLGTIEQRTNEILTIYLQQQAHRDKLQEDPVQGAASLLVPGAATTVLGTGPSTQMNSIDLKITAPTTGEEFDDEEDSDDEEDDDRFLTREELKQRTLKGMSKKAHSTSSSPKHRTKSITGSPK